MKIFTDFSILSETTLFDTEKNSLSIMNVVDAIEVDRLPAIMSDLKLVNRFTVLDNGDASEIPLIFKLVRPDESTTVITSSEAKKYVINVQPNQKKQRAGIIIKLTVDVQSEGEYTIKTFYKEAEIASQQLDVSLRK